MAKAGPKGKIEAAPLDLDWLPEGRAEARIAFIEKYVRVPKGVGAREPFKLRDWQKDLVRGSFAPGMRTALVSLPRANGKTALAAALAVADLFIEPDAPEVLVVASDQRQANVALKLAQRMVEVSPDLDVRAHRTMTQVQVPHTGGVMSALPADPGALHGHDPSLLIVDELHVVTEAVWEAVSSVSGKRPESLTLAISTPSSSTDSIMWRLVEHGRTGEDPAFFLREFYAPTGCDLWDHDAWAQANPALGDFLSEDGMAAAARTLREPTFRQLRLGQWVTGVESWLPHGMFEACADPDQVVEPGQRVVVAFDGSASGDSTALIGCTLPDVGTPHLFVCGLFENPGDPRWRVPRSEVAKTVDAVFDRFDVVELVADPWGWRTELEAWAEKHGKGRVIQWNTAAASRMAPATDRMYQAVVTGQVTHDGDKRLEAHFAHAVAKSTPMGDLVSKAKKSSPLKIDAAVAAIVALDRAHFLTTNKPRRRAASF